MDQIVIAICNCLPVGLLSRHFCYVVSCVPFVDSLAREMNELGNKQVDVQRMVGRAEREGKEPMEQVKGWLEEVGKLQTETQAIRDEFSSRRPTLYEDCKQHIWSSYRLNKRADELLLEARELKGKGNFTEVADESAAPIKFIYMPPVPNAVGMDKVLERLHVLVNDDDVGMIGIHGMGGVGKTALLRTFHNQYLAGAAELNMVIWVDVTKDGDEKSVQEAIKDRLKLSWEEKKLPPTERADKLRNALQKMNNFVVFLDDMWKPLDLHAIGIPTPIRGGSKQKIILATRKENVCGTTGASSSMGATTTTLIKIECLAWKDSWSLFTAMAAGGEDRIKESHPDVQRHAEKLAKKCGGLPLALTHVGGAMIGKRTPEEWRRSLRMMDITPWHLPGMAAHNVLKPLELSYDDLSDHKMRTFLLYSSLFPNDHSVRKESVIKYGIGEGTIDDFSHVVELDTGNYYEEGHYLIGNIKAASSLIAYADEDDDDYIQMHPMVRAMVSWISCDHGNNPRKCLVAADLRLREAFLAEYWKDAKWISLMNNDIQELPESPNCQALQVLLLRKNENLKTIPRDFFLRAHMPALRVLDLSYTAIEEFPPGIEALVSLQYLNLSNTKITSLPAGLKALSQLRVLRLSFTPLESIPEGVIASLTQLRVLDMEGDPRVGSGVISLEELDKLNHLKSIGITVATLDCLERISQSSRLVRCLRELTVINWEWLSTEVVRLPFNLPSTRDMVGLHQLRISKSSKLKKVVIGSSGICSVRSLPNLQILLLEALTKAKFISWRGIALQNLRKLMVSNCKSMEQLIEYDEEEIRGGGGGGGLHGDFIPFPNLKEICLKNLPELRMLSARGKACNFPSLVRLKVLDCPKLKKLGLDGAEKVKVIYGQQAWWDALEWDDSSLARCSSHLFRVYNNK